MSILLIYVVTAPGAQAQTRVDAIRLKESCIASAVIDSVSGFAFLGTGGAGGGTGAQIVTIRLSDFTEFRGTGFNLQERFALAVIDTDDGYAYFLSEPNSIFRVRTRGDVGVTFVGGDSDYRFAQSAVIDSGNGFVYFGTATVPGKIVKVRLRDAKSIGSLILNPGENDLRSAVIDTAAGFAYFGTDTQPGIVVKVNLSDFTRVGTLKLNPDESGLNSAVIDTARGFAYFGTATSPGKVVKVDLSTFTRVGSLTLGTGENKLGSAVLDADNGFAYFGTLTSPGRIVKIRLSDLTRTGASTLNPGEDDLGIAVIDAGKGFAYFGTCTKPGIFVKVNVASPAATTTAVTVVTVTSAAPATSTPTSIATSTPPSVLEVSFPFGLVGLGGLVAAIFLLSTIVLVRRRKDIHPTVVLKTVQEATRETVASVPTTAVQIEAPPRSGISTGYQDLDHSLAGGLPEGYAVVIVSPSYDERDLLVRRIIKSALSSGRPTFFLSSDIAKTRDLTSKYGENFYALSPLADRMASEGGNLLKIPDVGDLSDLNITSNKIMEAKAKDVKSKLIIIDFLTDVLLRNKALTTRRWLSDFTAKRKAEGFTVLATLDPSIAKEDTQIITGVFDGIIEIYEKQLMERTRRFLLVKKMYGRRYSQTELMLDMDKLL